MLKPEHLKKVGVTDEISVAVAGLENVPEFQRVVIGGMSDLNVDDMREGVREIVRDMLSRSPEVRSLLLECSNLPCLWGNAP